MTVAVETMSLSMQLRRVLDDTDKKEPQEIATIMTRGIMRGCTCGKHREIAAALQETLVMWVRTRFNGLPLGSTEPSTEPDTSATATDSISTKWRCIRLALGQNLRGYDGYKLLAEFTIKDLRFSAAVHRDLAERNERRAVQFEALAAVMAKSRIKLVRDVPQERLEKIFG